MPRDSLAVYWDFHPCLARCVPALERTAQVKHIFPALAGQMSHNA